MLGTRSAATLQGGEACRYLTRVTRRWKGDIRCGLFA